MDNSLRKGENLRLHSFYERRLNPLKIWWNLVFGNFRKQFSKFKNILDLSKIRHQQSSSMTTVIFVLCDFDNYHLWQLSFSKRFDPPCRGAVFKFKKAGDFKTRNHIIEKYRRNIGYCSITKTVSEATERLPAMATSTEKEQAEVINSIQQQSLVKFKEWEVVAVFREIVEVPLRIFLGWFEKSRWDGGASLMNFLGDIGWKKPKRKRGRRTTEGKWVYRYQVI